MTTTRAIILGTVLAAIVYLPNALGQSYTFVGNDPNNDYWSSSDNWSPVGVPGPGDSVTINYNSYQASGSANCEIHSPSVTIASLTITGVGGQGNVNQYGCLQIDSGQTLTVTNSITLTQSLIQDLTFGGATLIVPSTCTITSSNVDAGAGAFPLGANIIQANVILTGNVNLNSGGMPFHGGGTVSAPAVLTVASGASLGFGNNSTTTLNSGITLSGSYYVSGKINVNFAMSTGANFDVGTAAFPGFINGTGSLTTSGFINVGASSLNGTLNVPVTINSPGDLDVNTNTLTVNSGLTCNGTATVRNGGTLNVNSTTTFNNTLGITGIVSPSSGAVVQIKSGVTMTCNNAVTLNYADFNGSGTLVLSAAASLNSMNASSSNSFNTISPVCNTAAPVTVQSGILEFDGGGSCTNTMTAQAGTELGFDGNNTFSFNTPGTFTATATSDVYVSHGATLSINDSISYGNLLILDFGSANSSGTVNGTGSLTITSGGKIAADDFGDVLAVNTTLMSGATLLVDNSADNTKTGSLTIGTNVNCDGTLTIKSAMVTINSGSTLACTGNVNFNPPAGTNAFNTIINGAGTISSSGTLTSKMNPNATGINVISAVFINSGPLVLSSGILEVSGGGTNSSSMTATTAGTKLGFLTTPYHNTGTLFGTVFVANTTLSLDAPLSFGGTLLLDGTTSGIGSSPGTLGGVGPLTITGTGSINANTAGDALNCPTASIAAGGSINVSSGTLSVGADVTTGGGTNITNGTLSIASLHTLSSSGAVAMNNSANFGGTGTLSITAGTLISNNTGLPAVSFNHIDCILTNAAAVSVTNGSLQIENTTTGSSSGTLTISTGAQLGFYNGNFAITGTLSGGQVFVANDTLFINTALSYGGTLDLDGTGVIPASPGTISGSGSLNLSGSLVVQTSGDALNIPSAVSGSVTINPGTLLVGADMICNGTIGITNGTMNIAALHTVTCNGTATLNNNGNLGGAGTLTTGLAGSVTSHNTNGATPTNFIDCVLNNTGSVSVTAGVLQVENTVAGASSGSLTVSNGCQLGFASGSFAINAGTLTGGTVYVSNDTLNINTTLSYGGTLILDGGIGNAGTLAGSGSLAITSGGLLQSSASGDQLSLPTTLTSATITVGTGCSMTCTNNLTIDRSNMTGSGVFAISASGTMSSVNANSGFPAYDNTIQCAFNNAGTVTVTSGTLELDGGGTNTGNLICNAGNQLGFYTTAYTNSGAGTISGDVYVASTTLNIYNTLTLNGPLHLDGAPDRASPGTIAGTGSLTVTGPIYANVVGDALNVPTVVTTGSITVNAGTLSLGATASCAGPVGITTGSINIALGKTITCSNAVSMNDNANFGGSGTLSIPLTGMLTSSNAAVSNTNFIDCNLSNAGAVSITNGNLQIENSSGGSSSGSITLSNGTQLNLSACTFANTGTISGGALSLGSATLNENTSMIYGGTIGLSNSTINIASTQTLTCNGAVTLSASSGFGGTGTLLIGSTGSLSGAGTISGNLSNSGLVGLGATTGTLTIGGNFVQNSTGTLHVNVGGRNAGQFDVVKLTGGASSATLTGTLEVALVNAFVPTVTDAFDILTYPSESIPGPFSSTTGASGLTAVYGSTRVTLAEGPPIITSPTTAIGVLSQAFNYTITSNAPATYTITGILPPGLTSNANSIFGTPTTLGVFNLTLTTTNILGSSNSPLTITINPPAPVINSVLTATGIVGTTFSYKITATNSPTSYSAGNLPPGLALNVDTISGIPTTLGTFNVSLGATNVTGTGSATLVITINPPAPVINSVLTASGIVGTTFSYKITATNSPASYSASNLPPGLALNVDTISGIPTTLGTFNVSLGATNVTGTGSATLVITITAPDAPQISSPLTANATVGQAFSYKITASGNGSITFNAMPLPSGLTFAVDTISGTPTIAGAIDITLSATNFSGSNTRTLRLVIASAIGSGGTPPAIDSDPTATPNPAVAGQPVAFSTSASDVDGDLIAYSWDYGDGTSGNGSSTSHTYAAPGLYTATVTVTDGSNSVSASVEVAVNADAATNATLTQFVIQKLSLKLNLVESGKDTLNVSGILPVASGFNPNGKNVTIEIGGLQITSSLSGKGLSTDKSFKLAGKMGKSGAYITSPLKFSLSLKNQSLASKLSYGTKSNSSAPFVMAISLDGENMIAAITTNYVVKAGKSGSASGPAK